MLRACSSVDRATGEVRHRWFADLPDELAGHLTVVNDTRVVPARLRARRETGGEVEVLLVEALEGGVWEALARPSRRLRAGERLQGRDGTDDTLVELVDALGDGRWVVRLAGEPAGEMPLPPYIHERPDDPERYQTVYARERAPRPRRRPACTSRPSCSARSTTSASRSTSGWTRSGR